MKEFLEWLNSQSGDRLFGYCLFTLFVLYIIFEGIAEIVRAHRKNKNNG